MKMFSSHIVVTKHIPNEADNVPRFFFCMFFTKKKTHGIFLLNAYIHKGTLII